MSAKLNHYLPFYSNGLDKNTVSIPVQASIAIVIGGIYLVALYLALPERSVFIDEVCWLLGAIISGSLFALYRSTEVFHTSLYLIQKLEGATLDSQLMVSKWLAPHRYVFAGTLVGTVNVTIGHFLGVPSDFFVTPLALTLIYVGFFLAGFANGMGVQGVVTVITLYVRFAPNLQNTLEPRNPDGIGGIKRLGDSLWFFTFIIAAVAFLISTYIISVSWTGLGSTWVQILFLFWIATPYLVAIAIVVIPGLAVQRQIVKFKRERTTFLKQQKARLYTSIKKTSDKTDDEIIAEKKLLSQQLEEIQEELSSVKKMRNSHIDSGR